MACTPERELSPATGTKSASTLILDFLAGPELWEINLIFCCLSHPFNGFCYNVLSQLRHLPISPLVTRCSFCSSHTWKTLSPREAIQSLTQSCPQTPSAGFLADDMHLSPLGLQVAPVDLKRWLSFPFPISNMPCTAGTGYLTKKKPLIHKRERWEPHVAGPEQEGGFVVEVGSGLSLPVSGEVSWIDLTWIWVQNFLVHCALWLLLYPLWESTTSLSSTVLWSGLWEDAPSWGL